MTAFKVFTNAQNIALEKKNDRLMPAVYHAMATLYHRFKKEEEAKKEEAKENEKKKGRVHEISGTAGAEAEVE